MPVVVPTLDEIAADPTRATGLPVDLLQVLYARCSALQASLLAALIAAASSRNAARPAEPDALLDVAAAAKRLATTPDWLYRHAGHLPFTVRNGRQLRFSTQRIDRYIRERQAGPD